MKKEDKEECTLMILIDKTLDHIHLSHLLFHSLKKEE